MPDGFLLLEFFWLPQYFDLAQYCPEFVEGQASRLKREESRHKAPRLTPLSR